LVKINYINPEQINIVENLVLAIPFEGGWFGKMSIWFEAI
jgi:hypothetical protein